MEVVVLNELVKVNAKHLESNADMGSECEASINPHDVLTVLMVLIPESLQDFDFNLTLLMEFLPVLKDLNRYMFFGLMVKAPENYSKGSPSELLLDLIPV